MLGCNTHEAFPVPRLTVGVSNEVQMTRNLTGGLPVVNQGHLTWYEMHENEINTRRQDPNPRNKYNVAPETARVGYKYGKLHLGRYTRPPPLWAPCCSTDILLPPIYTYVPSNYQIRSQNPNSTAATFCIHEIPSRGLFRSSTGGGIDHGGLLDQHHRLSDEV